MEILLLLVAWFFFLFLTFRPPAPNLLRLFFFLVWLGLSAALAFMFAVQVLDYDPEPDEWRIARWLTDDRMIDLADIAPGVYHPDYIYRIDTDGSQEGEGDKLVQEWLVVYKYDVAGAASENPTGPFGASIYDPDHCRPPVIHSYELVPVNYDYLGQDGVKVHVDNIIDYDDPLSLDQKAEEIDRPEVLISGVSRGVVTDLNIFRKVGTDWACVPRREVWITPTPGQVVTTAYTYQNIGTFRGTDQVRLDGSKVTVLDRAGWERSQIVSQQVYKPQNGSYFRQDDPTRLLEPEAVGLAFGAGHPDNTRQVYYPEKTVLAFFLDLGPNTDRAMSNVCGDAKGRPKYYPEDFGLTVPARQLEHVVVCELAYVPNVQAEQNHQTQTVTVKVVEVTKGDSATCQDPIELRCTVVASPNPDALPYGCEWCLQECVAVP